MIGCGQFAFATIGYFLGRRFVTCYDPAHVAARTFARFYDVDENAASWQRAIEHPAVRLVYIASTHSTHAQYAVAALNAGKAVYVEKPIAVEIDQLKELLRTLRRTRMPVFAGYNRPFSAAVRLLRGECVAPQGPLTLSCFVSGHRLPPQHWYRGEAEGTRICGNVGHWLDLAVHILSWRSLPERWNVSLSWSDAASRDDDLVLALTSEQGDLINIVLTARSEPFEGINETINLQWGDVIAKIDDFRRMQTWRGAEHRVHRFWPKDVGHRRAILQPFGTERRAWSEVEFSTLLMLHIAAMVKDSEGSGVFSFRSAWAALDAGDWESAEAT